MAWRAWALSRWMPAQVQVLDVLAAQHLHQGLRGHHPEGDALRVHHRQPVHGVAQRERSGALLVGVRSHPRKIAPERLLQHIAGWQGEDARERRGAEQPPVRVDHQHQFEARGLLGGAAVACVTLASSPAAGGEP